jgi:hypothetical protein
MTNTKRVFKSQEVDDMSKCRLCGKCLSELQGSYLVRVNEKGVPGIWECLPCCEADLTQEEALLAALAPDAPEVKPEEVAVAKRNPNAADGYQAQ